MLLCTVRDENRDEKRARVSHFYPFMMKSRYKQSRTPTYFVHMLCVGCLIFISILIISLHYYSYKKNTTSKLKLIAYDSIREGCGIMKAMSRCLHEQNVIPSSFESLTIIPFMPAYFLHLPLTHPWRPPQIPFLFLQLLNSSFVKYISIQLKLIKQRQREGERRIHRATKLNPICLCSPN